MHYLVINHFSGLSYKDRYRLFANKDGAIEYAKTLGFILLVGVSEKAGVGTRYKTGGIDIMILPIEGV